MALIRWGVAFLLLSAPAFGEPLDFLLTRAQRAQKLVEEGQQHILRGNYLQAIDSCTRALGIREDWGPAYICRSEARLLTKDAAAASQDAQKAVLLDPRSGGPFRILGILEFQAGRYSDAVELFSKALNLTKMRPEDISDVYYYRAYSFFNLEKFPEALKDVDNGLGIARGVNGDYTDSSFYVLRAEIYRRMGRDSLADADDRAILQLIDERLPQSPPDAVELLRRRAEANAHLRRYNDAAKDYDRLLTLSPEDSRALLDQAGVYSLSGRHAEAAKRLDKLLASNPASLPGLRLRAMERFALGDLQGSLADLDAALAIKPDDATTLAHRGILKRYLADYRGSLKDFNSAQALNPNDPDFLGHKAYTLEMLEDHSQAVLSAQKALARDPQNATAHAALALAATALDRCDIATPSLNWLIRQTPNSPQYYRLRAECRCEADDLQGCLADTRAAAESDPSSPTAALRLAQVERRYLDRFSSKATPTDLRESVGYYEKAAVLKPLSFQDQLDEARTLLQLAEGSESSRARASLLREAESECSAVLRTNPKDPKALQLLRRIRSIRHRRTH